MQALVLGIVLYVLFKMLTEHEPIDKKIRRMDMQPNNIKSDKWKREHGEL
jgi:hypothetical protein